MYATLTLKLDRPFELGKHYISPGGYTVKLKDQTEITFDFGQSEMSICENNPHVIEYTLKDPDFDSFPDFKRLINNMNQIAELSECYIHTGEYDDPEIHITSILEFSLITEEYISIFDYNPAKPSPCMNVSQETIIKADNPEMMTCITEYSFTKSELDRALHKIIE